MKSVLKFLYEGIMLLLVMLTIVSIWSEDNISDNINWIIWAIFTTDFAIRMYFTKNRWKFLKENPFLVLAIIPLDQFFQLSRIVRVIYLFRIKTITKYYVSPYIERLTYKSKTMVFTLVNAFLVVEALYIWYKEQSVSNFFEGLYVTYGNLLFFGREIFEINDTISVWSLTATSIIGVIVQGLALQWLFTKLEVYYKDAKQKYKEIRQKRA
ncbi:transporter [Oceanobacillus piezotolerans]|uniref:Transporter n=1 Tax=Oceanobacillus piezotolerans TaxID=2448030 RepID=A0A498DJ08_9BACI|nr:transporter [Oceanobacillus piezotolerans]RLL41746.1 transporter [Oceanobacillus piezotolerans]